MEGKDKLTQVRITMTSGKTHAFTMTVEKAIQLVQMITYERREEGRQWIDIYDLTEAKTGQFVIHMSTVESIEVDPQM
ncbi:MAG: hypothetical protein JXA82_05155 [Sedimentisphaerales bacterium]|nr:hypothetical protein [Sedimentisphaerales bacterium]